MLGFKGYLVEKEIQEFAFDFEDFHSLNEEAATGVPASESKGGNHWRKVREGADKYFNASPEEQKAMQKEADDVLGKNSLLGDEATNPKLAKSGKTIPEYRTKGLTLAPSTMSGIDVCPAASKECRSACLGSAAGRAHMAPVKKARIDKTNKYFTHPHLFYAKIDREITAAKKSAGRDGQKLAVRLNVASDIPHEHLAKGLFNKHKDVSFYDYTKIKGRLAHKGKPDNYHLTLSSTGVNHPDSNWSAVRKHLDNGGVAAMAFRVSSLGKGKKDLPTTVHDEETGKKYRVIDGDEHDHRHLDKEYHGISDKEGVIAGLRFKGGSTNIERAGNFAVPFKGDTATVKKETPKSNIIASIKEAVYRVR